jgi:DNA-binding transcriptional LysR family regulator
VAQPEDLASLPFVANGALREPLQWHFTKSDFERKTVRMSQTLTINTTPAVLAATLAGAGLAVLPDFLAMEDIKAGRLTPHIAGLGTSSRRHSCRLSGRRFPPAKSDRIRCDADGEAQAHGVNQGKKAVGPVLGRARLGSPLVS